VIRKMDSIESLGFHVIQVAYDETSTSPHQMFIKQHSVKNTDNAPTLFLVNVPCYCSKPALNNIFKDCGPIDSIRLAERPGPAPPSDDSSGSKIILNYIKKTSHKFKVAYITFKASDSIDIALQLSSDVIHYMSTKERPVLTGLAKWMEAYASRYPDTALVQKEADLFMAAWDQKEAEEKDAEVDALLPDAEGWVTIPVKKNTSVLNKKEKNEKRINKKADRKKRNEKELQNFYLFQQREAKRDKIAVLRQQFEEDKKRIAQMQQLRKFKPFA